MIRSGQVDVNGTIRRDPETPVRVEHDRIAVNGRLVEPQAKIYLLMNKPRGAVATASDEKGRETVYSVLASSEQIFRPGSRQSAVWTRPAKASSC